MWSIHPDEGRGFLSRGQWRWAVKLKITFLLGCLMGAAIAWLLSEMAHQRMAAGEETRES